MTILYFRIKVKIPDNQTDTQITEIFKKYMDVLPVKACSMKKVSDSMEWLY